MKRVAVFPHTGDRHIYYALHYQQRGFGIGNSFCSLFRWVRTILWSGSKAVGSETLRTSRKILTDISKYTSSDVSAGVIVSKYVGDVMSKHATESTQRLINKLRGRDCKRVRRETKPGRGGKKPRKQSVSQ